MRALAWMARWSMILRGQPAVLPEQRFRATGAQIERRSRTALDSRAGRTARAGRWSQMLRRGLRGGLASWPCAPMRSRRGREC
jgi:hypothetical protein